MLQYQFLHGTDEETLHHAFVEAFSDYQVKIDLPLWKFQQMLHRRGFHPEISIGAFHGDRLVGFVLNGLRQWNGKMTAYDLGTGVVPEHRRQGITTRLLAQIKELLPGKQVEQYLLEVLKPNESAFQLYLKQGFEIQREFSCFVIEKATFAPRAMCQVEWVDKPNLALLQPFWDFVPSWQNSIDSIHAAAEHFRYAVARHKDGIIGYGVIDSKTGDIPQIAVHKEHRGKGIGSGILTELIQGADSQRVAVLNVDAQYKQTVNFLLGMGFTHHVDQYEMLLTFK